MHSAWPGQLLAQPCTLSAFTGSSGNSCNIYMWLLKQGWERLPGQAGHVPQPLPGQGEAPRTRAGSQSAQVSALGTALGQQPPASISSANSWGWQSKHMGGYSEVSHSRQYLASHYRKGKKKTLEASAGDFIQCTSCCSGLWQLQL